MSLLPSLLLVCAAVTVAAADALRRRRVKPDTQDSLVPSDDQHPQQAAASKRTRLWWTQPAGWAVGAIAVCLVLGLVTMVARPDLQQQLRQAALGATHQFQPQQPSQQQQTHSMEAQQQQQQQQQQQAESSAIQCLSKSPAEILKGLLALDKSWIPLPDTDGSGTAPQPLQQLWSLALLQLFGFDQAAAHDLCELLLHQQPGCALCHWCLALAAGPHPNKVTDAEPRDYPTFGREDAEAAEQASARALQVAEQQLVGPGRADEGAHFRLALINATAARFAGGAAALHQWHAREQAHVAALEQLAAGLLQQLQGQGDAAGAAAGTWLAPAAATLLSLSAQALMNLSPWEYYTHEQELGLQLKASAARAEQLVLQALSLEPSHPLALHLHIHLAEAGRPGRPLPPGDDTEPGWVDPLSAERAERSADALAAAAWPQGHLQHMPSHIYVRLGRYQDAVRANQHATRTDVHLSGRCLQPYAPEHNAEMLLWAAGMAGMLRTAEAHASELHSLRGVVLHEYVPLGRYWTALPLVWVRFARWADVLQRLPPPAEGDRGGGSAGGAQFAGFVHEFARLMAMASPQYCPTCWSEGARHALQDAATLTSLPRLPDREPTGRRGGRQQQQQPPAAPAVPAAPPGEPRFAPEQVAQQLQRLHRALAAIEPEAATLPGAPPGLYASAYLQQARAMVLLAGAKTELAKGNATGAVQLLRGAVELEDEMGYIEPPRLLQPSRQCLGFAQRAAGDLVAAVHSLGRDLEQHPGNLWALAGLQRVCLAKLGRQGMVRPKAGAADQQGPVDRYAGVCEVMKVSFATKHESWQRMCACITQLAEVAAHGTEEPVLDSCLQLL